MKKYLCVALMIFTLSTILGISTSAANMAGSIPMTEEEFLSEVANGEAVLIDYGMRSLDSYTQEEIESDEALQFLISEAGQPLPIDGRSSFEWSMGHYMEIQTSEGATVKYYSQPKIEYAGVDIGDTGSSTFSTSFATLESVSYNGAAVDWINAIHFKNFRIDMIGGHNTAFTGYTYIHDSESASNINVSGIFGELASWAGYDLLSNLASILANVDFNNYSSNSYQPTTGTYPAGVSALVDDVKVEDANDGIEMFSSAIAVEAPNNNSIWTEGVAVWTFDVYYGTGTFVPRYEDYSLESPLEYIVAN